MNKVLTIIILIFISFIFAVYFFFPTYSEFKDLDNRIPKKESLLNEKKSYFLKLTETSRELEENRESLEKIKAGLPDELSPASLLNFFHKKALENGLVFESLIQTETSYLGAKEGKKQEELEIKETYFSLTLNGQFSSLLNFIRAIENSSRLIEVENVNLKISGKGYLDIILLIKVFSY